MAEKIKKLPEKTESEILFPGVQVNKYTVEPWGLVEIGKIAPIVMSIVTTCKQNNIKMSFENIEADLSKAIPLIIDDIINICSITLGVTKEEIIQIQPRADTITIAFTILNQNIEYLKNLPGLLGRVMQTIRS